MPFLAHAIEQLPSYRVKAWHFEAGNLQIPADVTRIDREAIDRSLASSVPELLETEANLLFSTVSGNTSVSMRGFGEGSGLRSLILVDGQPLNPADMGRINWEQIPLDSVESVEVLRGGHNVLYGDKALAGVIKIETRRTGAERLDLEGRLASFGSSQGSVSGALGNDLWSVSGGFFEKESDGYRKYSASKAVNSYLTFGRTFYESDDLDIRVFFGESEQSYPGGLIYSDFRADPRASDTLGDQGTESRNAGVNARWEGQRDWGSWELLSGYDTDEIDWTFGAGAFGRNEQAGLSFKPRVRSNAGSLVIIAGGDLLYDTLDFSKYEDASRNRLVSESALSERRVSPYMLAEYEWTDRLSLSAGARYEWVRYEVDSVTYDGSQLNSFIQTNRGPRPNPNYKNPPDILEDESFAEVIHQEGMAAEISLNYQLRDDTSLWVGYDRVYRYPVFDERASYQGFELADKISQGLEAEEGDNYEIGLKYMSSRHEFYATAFLLLMDNEIVFDSTVLNAASIPTGLNVNLGPVRRLGGDIAYSYTVRDWGFSTRLSYIETKQQAGVGRGYKVPLVPDFHAVSQIWWAPVDRLRLRWIHRYVGERFEGGDFTNSERSVEDYSLFDWQIEVDASPHCRLFVKIENVLDRVYAESAFEGLYYPGEGRSISLGMKLNF